MGQPDVIEVEGDPWVDTTGDGVADVPLTDWCPSTVMENPQWWRRAGQPIAASVGFDSNYRFALATEGRLPLCWEGTISEEPLWWACHEGDIEVYGGGYLLLYTGPRGLLATITITGEHLGSEPGWDVTAVAAKDGRTATGVVYDARGACR